MSPGEKRFTDYWGIARKNWNWGKKFKKTALHLVLPLVVLVDFINFFIIGDLSYGFISLEHLWRLGLNSIVFSILIGFVYNLIVWNTNEMRYWSIMKREERKNP
ncbi:MAG TPA: hypothetical protein VGE26_11730 [Sphingobacteriaceae bacterium]